jgi:hypothetical protein
MNMNENSLMVHMNPAVLIAALLACVVISMVSAGRYRNTYDFKKALIHAVVMYTVLAVVLILLHISFLLIIGYGFCTFVFTACFSNYYFYKK